MLLCATRPCKYVISIQTSIDVGKAKHNYQPDASRFHGEISQLKVGRDSVCDAQDLAIVEAFVNDVAYPCLSTVNIMLNVNIYEIWEYEH